MVQFTILTIFKFPVHKRFFSDRTTWLCGILVSLPPPWIETWPWQWKHGVLTTGPPGNSQVYSLIAFHIFTSLCNQSLELFCLAELKLCTY